MPVTRFPRPFPRSLPRPAVEFLGHEGRTSTLARLPFMKAVYCSLVKGSSTPRSAAASCKQCLIRPVVACGRSATPPRRWKISKRTCTVLHLCIHVAPKTEDVSQRTRSSILSRNDGILKGHPSKNGRSEPVGVSVREFPKTELTPNTELGKWQHPQVRKHLGASRASKDTCLKGPGGPVATPRHSSCDARSLGRGR